jgi:hypothetical protein
VVAVGAGIALESTILVELEKLLFGWNYAVHLRCYVLPKEAEGSLEAYVRLVLPNAEVGGQERTEIEEMLAEVEQSLRYGGDSNAGPMPEALASSQLDVLIGSLLHHLRESAAGSPDVTYFWLKEGHPDWPVYWDFAYLLEDVESVAIIIGSSSD